MKKKLLILFGFLLALAAILFNQQSVETPVDAPAALKQQDSWQAFNNKTWRINKQQTAKEQNILSAKFMQESGDFVQLKQPFIEILSQEKLITLASQKAEIFQQNIYSFAEKVELNQYANQPEDSRLLQTEQLDFNQADNLATTDLAVKITSLQQITKAIGMEYSLNSKLLNLKSNVKTIYEPTNQTPNP